MLLRKLEIVASLVVNAHPIHTSGPNGAGKTTYYETAIAEGFISSQLPFINADLITRSLSGGYTRDNFAKADVITRQKIAEQIQAMSDFMIESNLATKRDYEWVKALIKKGYEVVLFFLCTSFIEININRVKKRVAEGGHDIAEPIIEHRYKMGLSYLKGNLHLFHKAYLIDNSEETTVVMAELNNGIIQTKDPNLLRWVSDALYIAERIRK